LEPVVIPEKYEWVRDFFMVVRDNPFEDNRDVLGIVGQRYNVMQNEALFEFGDNLLDGGGRWETAGSIKGGRVVFGSLALERETVLDSEGVADKINTYLLVHTSHEGSVSVQASVTPVRVVCQNTLNIALRGVNQSFKMRHTQSLDGKVEQARRALSLSFEYMNKFEAEAKQLFETSVTNDKFIEIINTVYPKPEKGASKASLTKWENKVIQLDEIYASSTVDGIRDTAWGAFNTLTERLDWFRTPRKGNGESAAAAASGFDAATNAEKNRIMSVVKALTAA
jgi:phage/plasmid-like protein (TIGR03299 family)